MLTRIVVGADGSSEAKDAVALAAAIATASGSGLTLLGAFPPWPVSGGKGLDRSAQARAVERQLSDERRRFAPYAHVEAVADGDPARALLMNARRWHADLIVIGSTADAPVGRCAIGRTGRRLLNRMAPAVAIAARGLHELGTAELHAIGVGYDGGPESEHALQLADELAAAADAELQIHTVNRDPVPAPRRGGSLPPELLQEIREGVQLGALKTARRAAARTRSRSHVNPSVGDPGSVLKLFSDGVDVMVIGSRRWGPIARVVLGGVGEALAGDCGSSLIIAGRAPQHSPAQRRSPHADPHQASTSAQAAGAKQTAGAKQIAGATQTAGDRIVL